MTTGVGCDLIQIHRLFDDPDPAVEHQLRNGLAVQQEDGNCTLLERGLGCVPRESAGGDPLCIRWRPQRDTHLCGSRQYGAPRGERRDGVGCGLLVAETLVPHQRLAAWPSRRTKEDVFDGVVPEAGAGAEGHALLSLLTGLVYAQAVSGSSVRLSMCPEKAPRRGLRGPRQWAALRQGRALRGVRGMSGHGRPDACPLAGRPLTARASASTPALGVGLRRSGHGSFGAKRFRAPQLRPLGARLSIASLRD